MNDDLIPIAALLPAGWLGWVGARVLLVAKERVHLMLTLRTDPVLALLGIAMWASTVAFLVWIGTLGRLPLAWTPWSMGAFGIAMLIWHESYSRRNR